MNHYSVEILARDRIADLRRDAVGSQMIPNDDTPSRAVRLQRLASRIGLRRTLVAARTVIRHA